MKKYGGYKDTRLLEMLDYLDEAYIAEVVDNLNLQNEPSKPLPKRVVVLRSIRTAAALVACALLLGALIPVISYVTANFPDFVAFLKGESTTEPEFTEREPDETTVPPETTEEVKHEHNGSEGLIYKINDDGKSVTLISFGTFDGKDAIVASLYDGMPVTAIADGAFEGSECTTITVPESVISIGVDAFKNCTSLKTVGLPTSLSDIGANAFEGCVSLTSIGIPRGLKVIPTGMFANCESLRQVRMQPGVERIIMGAFLGCKMLDSIEFAGEKTDWMNISKGDFWHMQSGIKYVHCNNGSITIQPSPSGAPEHNGSEGLEYSLSGSAATLESCGTCTDKDVVIATTYMGYPVKWIAKGVFDGYSRMESVSIPETVVSIRSRAFGDCSKLESISLGASVSTVAGDAFRGCSSLEKIEIDPDNAVYRVTDNCLIEKANGNLVLACNGFRIPDDGSVDTINEYAFSGCTRISELVIPEGVHTLKSYALSDCPNLRKVSLPSTLKSAHRYFLAGYETVPTIIFPNGNDNYSADGNCFTDKNTKTVLFGYAGSVIPDWATSIGEGAFSGCTELVSINFPASLHTIGEGAFRNCTSLEKIKIEGNTTIYSYAFFGCEKLCEVELGDSVGFYGGHIFSYCTSLESIRIPKKVTWLIAQFEGCNKLSQIILHDDITDLNTAFYGCSALESIYIGEKVHKLSSNLFYGCESLREIVYGGTRHEWHTIEKEPLWKSGYVNISAVHCSDGSVDLNQTQPMAGSYGLLYRENADGKSASFIGFKNEELSSFELAMTYNGLPVTGIAEGALSGISSSGRIIMSNNIEKLEKRTFAQSPYISHIELMPNLKSIEEDAFLGCISLKELTFRGRIEAWNKLEKGDNWNYGTAIEVVHCLDGDVSVTPHPKTNDGSEGLVYRIAKGSDGNYHAVFAALGTCTDTDIVIASEYYSYPVLELQQGTLRGMTGIKSIKLPDAITAIPNSFFNGCTSLEKVYLPDKLVSIGQHVFQGCTSLEKLELPETLQVIGNYAFSGCSALKKVDLPESLTSIGAYVFEGTLIDSIHISKNIIDIGPANFGSNIKKITVDPDHPVFVITGNCLIDRDRKMLLRIFGEPEFPNDGSIEVIGETAFYEIDFKIKKLILPEGLLSIEWFSTKWIESVEELHIPSTFVDFNAYIFEECTNLKKITVAEGNPRFYSVGNCIINRETGELVLGCNTSVIPNDGSVKSIGAYVFAGCNGLKSIVIPEGVVEIGHGAFYGCTSLREVKLPESLERIGESAFGRCTALEDIEIGENVKMIIWGSFSGCTSLREVALPEDLHPNCLGWMLFTNCTSLEKAYVPSSTLYLDSFEGCTNLREIVFGGTLEEWNAINIGIDCFRGTALEKITCTDGVITEIPYETELPVIG